MNCLNAREYLSPLLDKEINFSEENSLKSHLTECKACQEYFAAMTTQEISLRRLAALPVPLSDPARILHRWRQTLTIPAPASRNFLPGLPAYWRYLAAPLTAALVLLLINLLPLGKRDFKYYDLTAKQAKLLENNSPENLLSAQLAILLTDLANYQEPATLNNWQARLAKLRLPERIAQEKLKALNAGDEKTYSFYTRVEIIVLNLMNQTFPSPQQVASISL